MPTKRKIDRKRHAFRFKVAGEEVVIWAKVLPGKQDVFLPLLDKHVEESIRLKGVGNSMTCSMAVCATREKHRFPHRVEGFIEWLYSRAYIVSRRDKNGMPSECYVYAHSDDIAHLNDSKAGQRKLLEQLQAQGGERIIHLRPIVQERAKQDRRNRDRPRGRQDGSRTRTMPRGAKLRFAVAQMSGVPN